MWNTAGPAGQGCAHLLDSGRHGLQMCQLGGRGGEERAVSRLQLPPWGPGREQSPSRSLPPLGCSLVHTVGASYVSQAS